MKNPKTVLSCVVLIVVAFALGFTPVSQEQTAAPLISIDMNALTAQVEASLNAKMDQMVADLEAKIASLEEKVAGYEARIAALEKLTNLPTITPAPSGTPTETPVPTRTPNPTGYDCTAEVLSPYYFGQFNPGSEFVFQARITNTGNKTWGKDVTLKYVSGLKAEVAENYAYALPAASVAPDETVEISIMMRAPVEKKNDGKFDSVYTLTNGEEDFCEFSYSIYVP